MLGRRSQKSWQAEIKHLSLAKQEIHAIPLARANRSVWRAGRGKGMMQALHDGKYDPQMRATKTAVFLLESAVTL
jgi:hypothetical protein